MNSENKHNIMEKVDTLLGKADIGFTKTPVDAWAFVEARINDETATKVVQLKRFNNHFRITSYNVCYTKLLRHRPIGLIPISTTVPGL